MQLLDDDMDELFRNAASDYPLKTDGADWDALRSKLQEAGSRPQGGGMGSTADSILFKLAILVLLTALFFIFYVPSLKTGKIPATGKDILVKKSNTADSSETNIRTGTGVTSAGNYTPLPVDDSMIGPVTDLPAESHAETGDNITRNSEQLTVRQTTDRTNPANDHYIPAVNRKDKTVHGNNVLPSEDQRIVAVQQPVTVEGTPVTSGITQPVKYLDGVRYEYNMPAAGITPGNRNTVREPLPSLSEQVQDPGGKSKGAAPFQKGLYAGVIVSPDVTTVKMQRFSRVGYKAGIIAGYRINRKVAVETGLLWDRMYYYSNGENFSTKRINVPSNMKVLYVDGWCNMFEIPVNVRYFFSGRKKNSWYVNAGMSSYLMKKESYNYDYELYGTPGTRNWSYKNSTNNLFSVIHVGVGFERPAGRLGNIRVEPYVKIPTAGIGIGDLPVTSIGVNIGLTKRIR